ncbi:MAG TPA: GNAT family N-acetyltransferase [Candidatus Saccharimonadales bacterium]|jgi:predicted GNAT family N-acyltransferase|nr:GNAT family N-acetyltransferase [Candidatus Saccharimonadales bacterium]
MSDLSILHFTGDNVTGDPLIIRNEVFVKEQGVAAEIEFDGLDSSSEHFVAFLGTEAVAEARVRIPYESLGHGASAIIEKVAVLGKHRKKGIGDSLMLHIVKNLESRPGVKSANLECPEYLMGFFRNVGFIPDRNFLDAPDVNNRIMYRPIH